MSSLSFAWMMYWLGSLGCSLVAWWMFSRAWRFFRYSAVATVLIILLVPFSIDPEQHLLAPAIFTIVFEGATHGLAAITKPLQLVLGLWAIVEIIIGAFVYFTRRQYAEKMAMLQQAQLESGDNNIQTRSAPTADQDAQQKEEPVISLDDSIKSTAGSGVDEELSDSHHSEAKTPRKKPSVKTSSRASTAKAPAKQTKEEAEHEVKSAAIKEAATKSKKPKVVTKEEPIRAIRD